MKRVQAAKLTGYSTECPHCGANLIGQEIPKESQHHFGGATNFLRLIGMEYDGDDCISAWRCPDCGAEDLRF
jgi:hypothetical protein